MRETLTQKVSRLSKLRAQGELSFLQEIRLIWIQAPNSVKSFLVRSLIGFLSMWLVTHAAVYYYALKYGMQLPLEGVPFLIVVSLVASSAISLFSALNITLQTWTASRAETPHPGAEAEVDVFDIIEVVGDVGKVTRTIVWMLNFAILTVITTIVFVSTIIFVREFVELETGYTNPSMILIGIVSTALVYFVSAKRKIFTYARIGSFIYLTGLAFVSVYLVFAGGTDHILRVTKFGGGIDVNLTADRGEYSEASLMLQTNSTIVIWDRDTGEFVWVPLSSIESMQFESDPMILLPPSRPVLRRVGIVR